MSLILDALKRAERDRRAEPTPGLEVPTLARPKRRRWGLRIAAAIGALLVVLLVLAVVARLFGKPAPRPAPPPVAQAQPVKPMTSPAPAPAPTVTAALPMPAPAKPAPIPGTESASTLDELTEEPAPPPVASATPSHRAAAKPVTATAPAATPAAPAAGQAAPAPATVEDSVKASPAPEPTEAKPAQPAPTEGEQPIPAALNQPAPLRKLREMPPEFRADFPALNLQVHNYEKDAPLRFVIVNDHRYKEGDRLAEGPQVVEIVHDGMVLEYRGEKFLYTLGR